MRVHLLLADLWFRLPIFRKPWAIFMPRQVVVLRHFCFLDSLGEGFSCQSACTHNAPFVVAVEELERSHHKQEYFFFFDLRI